MYTLTVKQTTVIDSQSTEVTTTLETQNRVQSSPSVPAAKTGNLTTRTNATTGTLTMDAGHGFITGDKIDLFYEGGQRVAVVVGTVATNSVPISGGTGDDLPDDESEITAMVRSSEVLVAVGDDVLGIVVTSTQKGYVSLLQSDNTVIKVIKIGEGGDTYTWLDDTDSDNPVLGANPLAGVSLGKILFSHDDSTAAHSPSVTIYYN